MNKEAYYFSHDCNARNDEKILAIRMRHGAEGYGIYFMIIERLRESTNYMSVKDYNIIAFDLRVSAEKIKSIIEDFKLFEFSENGKHFYSASLNNRMKQIDERRKRLSEAGKKGVEVKKQATLKPPLSHEQASKVKESKVKESKVKESEREENHTPDSSTFIKISELRERYENHSWLDQVGMKNNQTSESIKKYFKDFCEDLELKGDTKTEIDFRSHFINWLNKNLREKEKSSAKKENKSKIEKAIEARKKINWGESINGFS